MVHRQFQHDNFINAPVNVDGRQKGGAVDKSI
jgi:hypothetical protein